MPTKKQNEKNSNKHPNPKQLEIEKGIEYFYQRVDLQKIAYSVFHKYGPEDSLLNWEDVFSESIIRLMGSFEKGRFKNKAKLSTYFWSICFNYCQEISRKQSSKEEMPLDIFEDFIDQMIEDDERKLIVDIVLKQEPKCKRIFELLFFKEKPTRMDDIAPEVGLKGGRSVSTIYGRCKKKLIQALMKSKDLSPLISRFFKP